MNLIILKYTHQNDKIHREFHLTTKNKLRTDEN